MQIAFKTARTLAMRCLLLTLAYAKPSPWVRTVAMAVKGLSPWLFALSPSHTLTRRHARPSSSPLSPARRALPSQAVGAAAASRTSL